jgi:transcriptional regulator with XRE-family HTH domain
MRHAVDEHVGKRLRQLRTSRGLSQSVVADALGLTFQQVQKYERGVNRISASKLYDAAMLLGVTIESFFEGLPTSEGKSADSDIIAQVATDSDFARLVRLFHAAPRPARQQILALMEVLATERPAANPAEAERPKVAARERA